MRNFYNGPVKTLTKELKGDAARLALVSLVLPSGPICAVKVKLQDDLIEVRDKIKSWMEKHKNEAAVYGGKGQIKTFKEAVVAQAHAAILTTSGISPKEAKTQGRVTHWPEKK